MQATAPPVLPQAAEACKSAKIPFVLGIFVGDEKDRAQISANNPYYVGSVGADLYRDGYMMGQAAAKGGHKTAVLVGGNVGDIHFEQRIAGFTKSFVEEGGGKILDIARCSSPAEGQEKANALISANRDANCLYAMVGDYVPGSINAMDALGLKIPVYASNVGKESLDYIKEGRVVEGGAGNDLAAGIAVALLVNYLDGHPIVDEKGKAPELKTVPFIVNKDNVEDFISIFFKEGSHPFTPDFLKTLVWRKNPDVSYKNFTNLVTNDIRLEKLLKDHGK
jgi:ABC-type sugar transport system substrate-binding protein